MSVWSIHYLRALDQVAIALSTITLVRKGEEPLEHLGLNDYLGNVVEREKEGTGDRL